MSEGRRPDLSGLTIDRDAPTPQGFRLGSWMAIGLAVVLVVTGSAFFVVGAMKPLDVTVATAEAMGGTPGVSASASEVLTANGYVVARQRASVSSETAGRLVSMTSGSPPFRLRIAGTVSRFIGDGVGFARLVDVSSVKVVDIAVR